MENVVVSTQIILIGIVILETAIIFANWINSRTLHIDILPRNENRNSVFFGFEFVDY